MKLEFWCRINDQAWFCIFVNCPQVLRETFAAFSEQNYLYAYAGEKAKQRSCDTL